jgi:hypothetical protein
MQIVGWLGVAAMSLCIVMSRKHYSVDVVVAWYTVPLVFYAMHRRWTTKRPVQDYWPHRPIQVRAWHNWTVLGRRQQQQRAAPCMACEMALVHAYVRWQGWLHLPSGIMNCSWRPLHKGSCTVSEASGCRGATGIDSQHSLDVELLGAADGRVLPFGCRGRRLWSCRRLMWRTMTMAVGRWVVFFPKGLRQYCNTCARAAASDGNAAPQSSAELVQRWYLSSRGVASWCRTCRCWTDGFL